MGVTGPVGEAEDEDRVDVRMAWEQNGLADKALIRLPPSTLVTRISLMFTFVVPLLLLSITPQAQKTSYT